MGSGAKVCADPCLAGQDSVEVEDPADERRGTCDADEDSDKGNRVLLASES